MARQVWVEDRKTWAHSHTKGPATIWRSSLLRWDQGLILPLPTAGLDEPQRTLKYDDPDPLVREHIRG